MISRRHWVLRCSVIALLLYVFTHIVTRNGTTQLISEMQESGRSLAALDMQYDTTIQSNRSNRRRTAKLTNSKLTNELSINLIDNDKKLVPYRTDQEVPLKETNENNEISEPSAKLKALNPVNSAEVVETVSEAQDDRGGDEMEGDQENQESQDKVAALVSNIMKIEPKRHEGDDDTYDNPEDMINETGGVSVSADGTSSGDQASSVIENNGPLILEPSSKMITTANTTQTSDVKSEAEQKKWVMERLKRMLNCTSRPILPRTQQRGDYWVLYNYVRATERHECHESITYTTHGDYTFLDNLVPLLERWRGPISIALHAPGTDFDATLNTIKFLRECTSPLVKQHVTFHVFFSTKHVPKRVPRHEQAMNDPFNCSNPAPYTNVNVSKMYKTQKKLLYPINVGRNVARESAQTHFILPSDIELYPNRELIPQFLDMIVANKGPLLRKNPRVFVLSIFEVAAQHQVPDNKVVLKEMLRNGTAVEFHKKVCNMCHKVPKSKEWREANVTKGLNVFHIGKRTGPYVHWEPIFIGTHADPLYDERLSWEGKSDKMTQGYALCVLDYDFQILDNAFLCHKPGIKTYKKDTQRAILAGKTNQLIKKIIFPELKIMYGVRKGCAV